MMKCGSKNLAARATWLVRGGKRYWRSGVPVAGQQFEYAHDPARGSNRTQIEVGGDEDGANLRSADYSVNSKNQYTSRDVPPYIEVQGIANVTATVTVEGSSSGVYRHGEYFRKELYDNNSSAPQYPTIDVDTDVTSPISGEKYLPQDAESFGYDGDGNLTSDGRWTYTWDAENRLTKMERNVSSPSGARQKLEFEYDWQGRRIRKKFFTYSSDWQEQSDTIFLYDGWNVIAELNASHAEQRTYIWGLDMSGSMQGAGGVGGLLMEIDHTNDDMHHFAAHDGNGNVVALVKATDGTHTARYEYGPFGESIRGSGTMAYNNPFRFSSKYTDNESGLMYYGFRYYNSSIGRWLNKDPFGESGFETLRGGKSNRLGDAPNLYVLVSNKPLNSIDYWGLFDGPIPGPDSPMYACPYPPSDPSVRHKEFKCGITIYADHFTLIDKDTGKEIPHSGLAGSFGFAMSMVSNRQLQCANFCFVGCKSGQLNRAANALRVGVPGLNKNVHPFNFFGDYDLLSEFYLGNYIQQALLAAIEQAKRMCKANKCECEYITIAVECGGDIKSHFCGYKTRVKCN